jgi:type II secretory pathway component PulL
MQKRTIIKKIKTIIKEFGSFTTADVQAESSPNVASLKGINQLVESFNQNNVEVVTYDRNDDEIDTDIMNYEELSKDVLEEILYLAEIFEAEEIQTEKRISN